MRKRKQTLLPADLLLCPELNPGGEVCVNESSSTLVASVVGLAWALHDYSVTFCTYCLNHVNLDTFLHNQLTYLMKKAYKYFFLQCFYTSELHFEYLPV